MSYTYFKINDKEVTKPEFEKHIAQYKDSLKIAHTLLEKGYCDAILHPEIKNIDPNFLVALTKEEEALYKVIDTVNTIEHIPTMINITKAIIKAGYIHTTKLQYVNKRLSQLTEESQALATEAEYLSDELLKLSTGLEDIMED